MKKLMIAAAIVCAAACVQASSLSWQMAAVPASTTSSDKTTYTAYLFQTAGTDTGITTTLADIEKALASTTSFSKFVDDYAAVNGKNLTAAGGTSGATGYNGNNYAAGNSFTGYAVILDGSLGKDATAKNYIITVSKSVNWVSNTGAQTLQFGSQAAKTWQAIPEPTSGLLLLLGVAGLALKRKQRG